LGRFQTELGDILNELYQTNNEKEVLEKLIETFHNAGQTYKEAALAGRAAEAYWKAAVGCDRVSEHLESASNFVAASYQYELSAHNIPQLKSFYMDHATYMQAWTEIEKARHHHDRQEYGLAKEHYEKAATMHKSLKQWNYLASNYSAWAQVETAEDLSRSEKSEEALQSFEEAAKLFAETRKVLEAKEPCVIIATSGMLVGGPSVWWLKNLAENKNNSLVFVSYQAEGSLGRRIQKGWEIIV
jgi:tetratricopeptide (TPR) repeat protein